MNGTALNIIAMLFSIGIVVFVVKKEKLSYKYDIGLVFPKWRILVIWVAMFIVLMIFEEYIYSVFSNIETEHWKGKYTTPQIILRSVGIVILAPITEELIFRGILYWKIKNTRLKHIGAILIPAILFAIIHIQYSEILSIGIIFIDGLFYGLARHFSKSVVLAIILHALSNLGAVLERIL